jgi:hypothetical protein
MILRESLVSPKAKSPVPFKALLFLINAREIIPHPEEMGIPGPRTIVNDTFIRGTSHIF